MFIRITVFTENCIIFYIVYFILNFGRRTDRGREQRIPASVDTIVICVLFSSVSKTS